MTPPDHEGGRIVMPEEDFEALLERAARKGALQALKNVGLGGEDAADDIHELRSLLSALRLAKRTAWATAVRLITTGLLLALMAGMAIKFKLFGGGS